jgi:sugar-specific transcriptional regulator TrmB
MDTTELVETLKEAGLSPYQAAAYVTLLDSGTLSAQELAVQSDVPRPRIYDVLEALEGQGYVVTYDRDQLYAEALDPEAGVAPIQSRIERFRSATAEIKSRWRAPEGEYVDIGVVKRFRTVLQHTTDRIVSADHQILVVASYKQFLELEAALKSARQRGVFVQVSLHSVSDEQFDRMDRSQFDHAASEVRIADSPCMYEPFLAIIDGTQVSFAPFSRDTATRTSTADSESALQYGVLATDPIFAYVFEWYFLAALWEPSDPVFTSNSDSPPMEFVDIREVIRAVDPLLRDGATVRATVHGRRVVGGRQVRLDGTIVSVASDRSASPEGSPMTSIMTRQATVVLQADDDEVSIGGRGAYTEDIEATRVIITDVEQPE